MPPFRYTCALFSLSLLLAACGGDSDPAEGAGGAAGSGGSGASGATGGSGGGAAGSPAGACAAPDCQGCESCYHQRLCTGDDHTTAVDACIDKSLDYVVIESDPFTIEPGDEVYRCQNFQNPFGGVDVEVKKSESFMVPGSHHMFAFYRAGASDGPLESCSGLEFDRSLHSAQEPHVTFEYPEGVAALLKADEGIRLSAHYLNTGSETIEAKVTTVLYLADPGTITAHASHIFFNNPAIFVQPNSTGTASKTCNIPSDVKLLAVASHMHRFGTHFVAKTSSGELVYETDDWDDPPLREFDPPMDLAAGEGITFTCNYDNPTDSMLTFGDSADTDEMCILSGRYFPAADGETIECLGF